MQNEDSGITLPLTLAGDFGVGKTNIVSRYLRNTFDEPQLTAIVPHIYTTWVRLDEQNIKLKIVDTGGQERYTGTRTPILSNAVGFMLVYSIADRKSFENCEVWLTKIREKAGPHATILLVGNKTDMARVVTTEEGKTFASENQLMFIEVSALNGDNIQLAYMKLITEAYKRVATSSPLSDDPVAIIENSKLFAGRHNTWIRSL